MITYNDFISKHIGKAVDYDGVAGVQCVDLAKAYLHEVFGLNPGAWGDAHCYYDNYSNISDLKNNFTRIANTPDFVPQKGDICVWSSSLNSGWGHIAIATGEGNTSYFYSYDQNWTGRHDPCTRIKHNYNHFAGVLRPKDQTKVNGLPVLDKTGYKQGDKTNGVLALKQMLIIAKTKKLITQSVDNNSTYGSGTAKAVNQLLKKWGYKQNSIAGVNFIKRLGKELK